MSILSRILPGLFGRKRRNPLPSQRSRSQARGDLLFRAIRQVVTEHEIPPNWIGAETIPARAPSDKGGIHLRLVLRTADSRLLSSLVALERAIEVRLAQLDSQASNWMKGVSWRLDVPFDSAAGDLPGPDFWRLTPTPRTLAVQPLAAQEGRELLSRRLASRDRDFNRTVQEAPPDFLPTEPMLVP